jgi:hypothetical protein
MEAHMSRLKKYVGLATLVAIVAALGISSAVFAQSTTTPTPTAPTGKAGVMGHRGGFGLRSQAALDAAAKVLGMTSTELQAQLWGGKSLTDIAAAQKVDIATVQKAVEAALLAETKTAIQNAVTAGQLTQDKANWLIEGLDKGFWGNGQAGGFGMPGPMGFGMERGGRGLGFGMPGMKPGGLGRPDKTAPNGNGTTTPNSGTTNPSRYSF